MEVQIPKGKGHILGRHAPAIVTYLCMSALRSVCLPPHATDECIRGRDAKGDNTAMRPLAKLLRTPVV